MLKKIKLFFRRHLSEEILLLVLLAFLFLRNFGFNSKFLALGIYAFVVLILEDNFFSQGLKNCYRDVKRKYLYSIIVLIISALLLIWQVNLVFVVFSTVLLAFLFYSWDNRIITLAAGVSLAYCAVFLISKQDDLAEKAAAFTYYFLVVAILLELAAQVRDFFKGRRKPLDVNNP